MTNPPKGQLVLGDLTSAQPGLEARLSKIENREWTRMNANILGSIPTK